VARRSRHALSREALELVAHRFRALGDVVVKGKTQPVAIFEVVSAAAGAAPGMNKEASL
jgi:class 3 adenylate cyclase